MEDFILILELIGTCAFAISGAVAAIDTRLDIFGVFFCGVITALGGGVFRDILLGNLPPAMFCRYIYLIVALCSSLAVFLFAKYCRRIFVEKAALLASLNNIFDAAGLGVFTVVGISTAIAAGYGDNDFFVIFLGVATGCGGGILRDITLNHVPLILSKRIYAVASLLGGGLYYVLQATACPQWLSVCSSIALIFVLRILAAVFHWDLPKAF